MNAHISWELTHTILLYFLSISEAERKKLMFYKWEKENFLLVRVKDEQKRHEIEKYEQVLMKIVKIMSEAKRC